MYQQIVINRPLRPIFATSTPVGTLATEQAIYWQAIWSAWFTWTTKPVSYRWCAGAVRRWPATNASASDPTWSARACEKSDRSDLRCRRQRSWSVFVAVVATWLSGRSGW